MNIIIGSDHAGFELKSLVVKYLTNKGYKVKDFGTHSAESCDYPDIAVKVSKKVALNKDNRGILICGTGIGMSICANKIKGIRAALCFNKDMARLSGEHNNANVLCFGKNHSIEQACNMINIWLSTDFEGGRHARRIEKISNCERN